jgi:hypothetical protein
MRSILGRLLYGVHLLLAALLIQRANHNGLPKAHITGTA